MLVSKRAISSQKIVSIVAAHHQMHDPEPMHMRVYDVRICHSHEGASVRGKTMLFMPFVTQFNVQLSCCLWCCTSILYVMMGTRYQRTKFASWCLTNHCKQRSPNETNPFGDHDSSCHSGTAVDAKQRLACSACSMARPTSWMMLHQCRVGQNKHRSYPKPLSGRHAVQSAARRQLFSGSPEGQVVPSTGTRASWAALRPYCTISPAAGWASVSPSPSRAAFTLNRTCPSGASRQWEKALGDGLSEVSCTIISQSAGESLVCISLEVWSCIESA